MVDVSTREYGNVVVMTIDGEFYLESVGYAEEVWNSQVEKKPSVIAIDCSKIMYIDSSAIGIMVKFLNVSMKHKFKLIFFDLSETVVSVFRTAKLDVFFNTMTRLEFESEYLS